MANPHWHRWALIERRFNWLTFTLEERVVSTHHTREAARRQGKSHTNPVRIAFSRHLEYSKIGEWY